nr:hypothetical protein [Lachnospiraceae bacterium]
YVRIKDERYVYTCFETEGRKKKIAELDNWGVYEIKEDPNHIFLELKSFTSEHYIVKESYQIPTCGKVSCVYVDGKKLHDNNILEVLDEILTAQYDNGTCCYLFGSNEEQENLKHFTVGYEDCPVGTDNSIYSIGKIDSKWVVIFHDDVVVNDEGDIQCTYYELNEECSNVLEESKIWDN